ncbi:hypothetical protein [Phocoenobacter skyensis]|uniref:hypothetical protein n=1 Tax=Phocoenobacter skyensis TaxID=97481 RepID=UPI00275611FB|nr:hypothetical protein [Pasteurella skyensis]MDP8185339.1 hypothetical protein [Pasteurella skyensis]
MRKNDLFIIIKMSCVMTFGIYLIFFFNKGGSLGLLQKGLTYFMGIYLFSFIGCAFFYFISKYDK